MLLLFSSSQEQFSSLIEKRLKENEIFKFNLDVSSLKETSLSVSESEVTIEQCERRIVISQISGVWIKRQSVLVSSEEDQNNCGFADYYNYKIWKNEWNSIIKQLIAHLSYLKIPFFDERNSIIMAEKKLLQLDVAREIGFRIPQTIVTNSHSKIIDFLHQHNDEGILKLSTQPVFSKNNGVYFIFANKVSPIDFDEMDTTINSPFIIQNYIQKQYEVRYTYVNEEHFVCRIESQLSDKSKVDFRRYDFANTPYVAIKAPERIQNMVTLFMRKLKLNYGALDFIVDYNDDWHFLEVNPVGQYGWIEYLTGLPITNSIIRYLKEKKIINNNEVI